MREARFSLDGGWAKDGWREDKRVVWFSDSVLQDLVLGTARYYIASCLGF